MSKQLHTFIQNVLSMPHYSNDHAGSGSKHNSHEDALTVELTEVGFSKITQESTRLTKPSKKNPIGRLVKSKTFPKLSRDSLKAAIKSSNRQHEISKLVPGMPLGSFICQPCGSQSFPDFLVCDFSGTFVLIEAKSGGKASGGGRTPAWNDSLTKSDAIYIFSSGFYNETTVFLGQDVISDERKKFLTGQYEKIRLLVAETQAILQTMDDPNNRGFALAYARPKYDQLGGNTKVDYFTHQDRKRCEQNVLTFALSQ